MSVEYNALDTFRLSAVNLYREGTAEDEKFDIRDMVFEMAIYEDLFSGTMFAHLVLNDMINLPESFPIVGRELIDIRFNTPVYEDSQLLTFCVAKIGPQLTKDQNNRLGYVLHLITQDRYRDLKQDISKTYKGTYDVIVEAILKDLGSTTNLTKDTANYNQTFICPYWSPLFACQWIAKRAYGLKTDPFLFWETMDGYQFRSLHNVYNQEPYTKLIIEPGKQLSTSDRTWRRVIEFEKMESSNRMRQLMEGGYGVDVVLLDSTTRKIEFQRFDYATLSAEEDFATIDEHPLYPEDEKIYKTSFMYTRADNSHEGQVYRDMMMALMDQYRYRLVVPGDSGYRVGQIIELDIPDQSSSNVQHETLTSGRWLITSLRHLIKGDVYTCALEICKDSYAVDVRSMLGLPVESSKAKTVNTPENKPAKNEPAPKLLPEDKK